MVKLSDNVIGHIAQLLQMAVLTGTDITDNMRMIDLTEAGNGYLELSETYIERFNQQIHDMLDHAQVVQQAQASGVLSKDVGQS